MGGQPSRKGKPKPRTKVRIDDESLSAVTGGNKAQPAPAPPPNNGFVEAGPTIVHRKCT
jgi:hypothetical protein